MKRIVFGLLGILAGAPAIAADLPVKTATMAVLPCAAAGACSGWYAGFGILGDGTNADIVGGGINNSLFSTGGAIMATGGYQLWSGQLFAGLELSAGYEFNSTSAPQVNTGQKFVGTEIIKLGYNFFPSTQPSVTMPGQSPVALTVPANLLAASTPYLAFGGMQRRGTSEWVSGAGVQTVIASGWSTDLKYLYAPSQQGVPATNVIQLGVLRHF